MSPVEGQTEVDARGPAFDPDDPAVVARWQRTVSGLYDRRNEAAVRRVIERDILEPGPDPDVHRRVHSQPEHAWALEHYLSKIVSRERILAGKARLPEIANLFETVGTPALAVPAHVLAAIWGIETRYGEHLGHFNAARSLTTLAVVDVRRPALWAEELERLFDLIASGTFADDAVTGSWCGALGHTQFMPRTLSTFGIDADGDGRVDVIASPRDALASAANYLTARGWSGGLPPLLEVRAHPTYDWADWELADERPLADWQSRG
ncbi:MAG: lytic murein transglycosylase, partial [Pseudomonadota bacterium]